MSCSKHALYELLYKQKPIMSSYVATALQLNGKKSTVLDVEF